MTLDPKSLLLLALSGFTLFFLLRFGFYLRALPREIIGGKGRGPLLVATGIFTNFWDTLGIGSFATTTAIFRFFKLVPDELIPGTLNVGHCLPAIAQAFIFTKLVPVDARTLVLMIAAAVSGSWLGAGVVSKWPRRWIQVGMGFCLLAAATLMFLAQIALVPAGGDLLALHGTKLAVGVGVNFMLGALMTLGIGLYGPCMILVSLLGMSPITAFPIMMGSCAFLMPIASDRFMRARRFDPWAALGLLVGGVPTVIFTALIVKSLPLSWIRWLVIIVVVYTAVGLLRAASVERTGEPVPEGA